jgi:hypothetical protein
MDGLRNMRKNLPRLKNSNKFLNLFSTSCGSADYGELLISVVDQRFTVTGDELETSTVQGK